MIERAYKGRLAAIAMGVFILLAGLGVRLAFLHLGPNDHLEARVTSLRHMEWTISPERGRILDRRGNTLAMDRPMQDISIDPSRIAEKGHGEFIARHLVRILQVDPAMVARRMSLVHRKHEPIRRRVENDVADQLMRMNLHGVNFKQVMRRYYAQGPLMCHVLGFVNFEGVGSAGIEQQQNTLLRGLPGLRVTEKDGRRDELYRHRDLDIQPRPGHDVQLTLDQSLQFIMEEALDAGLEEYGGEAAWAIMMKVRTGEILAMASRPAYNLNEFRYTSPEERRNRAIAYNYEPGSTFKVNVIAAALNEGIVSPDNIIDCENGRWFYRGRPLRDYSPHGRLTVADVLKKSSNIGAAKIALMLPEAKLENYLRDFGIGESTGIDLPAEETGILSSHRHWSAISVSRIAMGHEVAVTALQQLNAINAIANDGFLMKPYVVQQIADPQGDVIYEAEPQAVGRPVRQDTARIMAQLMARITEEGGTGRRAAMEGYQVAGKTGTAQKPIPGGYSDRLNIASFVGFLPADDPEISMVVVVDEPLPLRTGGAVAAPIFKRIAEQAVRYLDIPSTEPDEAFALNSDQ